MFIVAHEPGLESGMLPTWGDTGTDIIRFDGDAGNRVTRVEIEGVPGVFQLNNVLSENECQQFIDLAESCGFHEDSPVSLPHSVRHNTNLNWVVSESIDTEIWNRCATQVPQQVQGQTAKGLNARFRFYRYAEGDFFKPHTDGSWPGSRVIEGKLVANAYNLFSQFTFLLFLSDDYEGGRTQFYLGENTGGSARSGEHASIVSARTERGAALCFPHGNHPLHCVHGGEPVLSGIKYIIRSDILFA